MSNIREAVKEIDEMIGHAIGPHGEEPECDNLRSIKKLLESEPEPTEFTKIQREAIQKCVDAYETEEWMSGGSIGIQRLSQACDIIDRLAVDPEPTEFTEKARLVRERGATHEQWEYATLLGEACDIIDRLTAEHADSKGE